MLLEECLVWAILQLLTWPEDGQEQFYTNGNECQNGEPGKYDTS